MEPAAEVYEGMVVGEHSRLARGWWWARAWWRASTADGHAPRAAPPATRRRCCFGVQWHEHAWQPAWRLKALIWQCDHHTYKSIRAKRTPCSVPLPPRRESDLEVNPVREKKLTNVRNTGSEERVLLSPPRVLTLEDAIGWVGGPEELLFFFFYYQFGG